MNDAAAWTQYWSSGQTTSLHGGGQAAVLAATWSAFFAHLPPGASILDLACGAGAVSKLALAAHRNYDVTGVDYAQGLPQIEGAMLKGGVSLEALPQADASFAAAVSQFGFEYADTGLAAQEVARIIAPGGQMALLMHAREGQPVADAHQRLSLVTPLIKAGGIVAVTQALVGEHAKGANTTKLQAQAATAWQTAAQAKQDETTHWAISFCGDIWRRRAEFTAEFIVDNMTACRTEIDTYIARLNAMIKAALDAGELAELQSMFEQLGLEMRKPESVLSNGKQIGWWLQGRKASH